MTVCAVTGCASNGARPATNAVAKPTLASPKDVAPATAPTPAQDPGVAARAGAE